MLTLVLALALVAFAVPAAIDSGLEDLPPGRRAAGAEARTLASIGCRDNPIQRVIAPALKLTWLSPTWDPAAEPKARWRPEIAARLRSYTVFGLPVEDITILDGGGISCWAVDLERDYPLASALAATERAGTARWSVRLPGSLFDDRLVTGRVDLAAGWSVLDSSLPPGVGALPFDPVAMFAAVGEELRSHHARRRTQDGLRFSLRDPGLAASTQRPWVVTAATVAGGRLRSIEYVVPSLPTLEPLVLRLFDFDGAEPLDAAVAVPS